MSNTIYAFTLLLLRALAELVCEILTIVSVIITVLASVFMYAILPLGDENTTLYSTIYFVGICSIISFIFVAQVRELIHNERREVFQKLPPGVY